MIGENISTKNDHQNITDSKKTIFEIKNFNYSNRIREDKNCNKLYKSSSPYISSLLAIFSV